ncbi:MarR family transcriptional regulator [Modestobacter sp. I12A-02628]|uniref:MarR family transcriptional regulator n=1 Tax=Goekera deserti TaxID=2497753 RepID=A0A7K3WDL0_9ACTN|nr:MarR family transcriptional regulator [Goekera deserti]MPQ98433.1 MarR family transcriptional regulator [Goekera deserti]NDI48260.1 MarR family transcriptional regulator [Goekera deserti]NEL54009.1 MarR family transcriptional regulator [Goekera deserti]
MSADLSTDRADAVDPPAPRWLDHDEMHTWRAWLLSSMLLGERLDRELTRGTGISTAYYEILVQLSEAPDRSLRMSTLAERCLSSRSRLSHAVSRLQERGWIRREVCPEDGRGQFAVLTDEGFAALAAAAPLHVESVRTHLLDQLSPAQQAALQDVGDTLIAHLGGPAVEAFPSV